MSICRQWSLVKHLPDFKLIKPLKCRAWSCDFCAPDRKAQLMALAASGQPQRFITLTINPRHGESPEDRLRALSRAWRLVVKRLRRAHEGIEVEYLAIVEETKKGEPHLHILLRSPYIRQQFLSSAMKELIDSPIVDIRSVRNQGEIIRYVAKYITKAPKQFGHAKRYWCSRGYELDPPAKPTADDLANAWFEVVERPVDLVLWDYACRGYTFTRADEETTLAHPTHLTDIIPFAILTGGTLISRQREAPP